MNCADNTGAKNLYIVAVFGTFVSGRDPFKFCMLGFVECHALGLVCHMHIQATVYPRVVCVKCTLWHERVTQPVGRLR